MPALPLSQIEWCKRVAAEAAILELACSSGWGSTHLKALPERPYKILTSKRIQMIELCKV